jgi:hypothetical protein
LNFPAVGSVCPIIDPLRTERSFAPPRCTRPYVVYPSIDVVTFLPSSTLTAVVKQFGRFAALRGRQC